MASDQKRHTDGTDYARCPHGLGRLRRAWLISGFHHLCGGLAKKRRGQLFAGSIMGIERGRKMTLRRFNVQSKPRVVRCAVTTGEYHGTQSI
ncbi:MAG: hypothetical protein COB81_03790 [Flavobacteriaceae bacterium]|nr:MAG: hypothetical protein COB81_03790 [Flavobacteriaceae bacterium]